MGEEWRKSMNIDKMILGGHSLGGYASCVYAMRYPQHIEHLILISPAGVPVKPSEFEQNYTNNWKIRTMFKMAAKIYHTGVTPHDIIRWSGPKGKGMVQRMVERRLYRLDEEDPLKPILAEYLYHVVAQKRSREYALNKILQPAIIFAWKPLAERIGELKQFQ